MSLLNRRILLTGGSGFVGTRLRGKLAAQGAHVAILTRKSKFKIRSNETFYRCDLLNRESLLNIVDSFRPDCVIHLADSKERACSKPVNQSQSASSLNSSKNLIEGCLRLPNLSRFVFTGTCDEYGISPLPFREENVGAPISHYGKAKLETTKILLACHQSLGFPVTILRPSIIYGPSQGEEMFLPALVNSLKAGREFSMTLGGQYRDFVFIDDVVNAISKSISASSEVNGAIINIASGKSVQIKDVALNIAKLISPKAVKLIKLGALPYREEEVMNYSVDIKRAKSLINWEPRTSFLEGLALTLNQQKLV